MIVSEFYEYPASFPAEAEASLNRNIGIISGKYHLVSPTQARKDIQIQTEEITAFDVDYQSDVVHKFLVKIVASGKTSDKIKEDKLINPERWASDE